MLLSQTLTTRTESRNRPTHTETIEFLTKVRRQSVKERQSYNPVVLELLDIHMQKNDFSFLTCTI